MARSSRALLLSAYALTSLAVSAASSPWWKGTDILTRQKHAGRVANVEYLQSLPGHPLFEQQHQHQPQFKASDPWNTTTIKGSHYIPSYSMNSIYTWVKYDSSIINKELLYAAASSQNTVRIALNWIPYTFAPSTFMANLEDFLTSASAVNIKVILALFDGTGCCNPDVSWITSGQYNSTQWVSSPGDTMVHNTSSWTLLDTYVNAITSKYGDDSRVIGFDVMYQPNLELQLPSGGYYNFLTHYTQLVSTAVNPQRAFTTYSVIPGGESCDALRVPTKYINVLSFENYNGNLGAIGGDTQGVQGCASSLASEKNGVTMPVILSGTMGRLNVPTQGLCDCLFEAYGQAWVDIPSHPTIGVLITNLMIGIDGSSDGPPGQPPNQGLIYPNGTWYSTQEESCMTAAVPPPPPPPPGPPVPIVNFTAAGLTVGLRPRTRTIQWLGLVTDERWYKNFSFVPPLWNFLPPQPHRDGDGAHHIGDIIFRVQPGSETNASSWAFYTTASTAGDGNSPGAIPLNSSDPTVWDSSDITPLLGPNNQPDTRYALGLNVTRSFQQADPSQGAAGGFKMQFDITNVNASMIRIGSLGLPMISNTNFGGLNLTEIAAFGSFLEGYPGGQQSFVTMARADGSEMLVVYSCAATGSPASSATHMEAWRPVLEDSSDTSGGVYSWEVVSGAFESEWNVNKQFPSEMDFPNDPAHEAAWPNPKSPTPSWHLNETMWTPNPRQFNPPTVLELQPGETRSFAVCFQLAMTGSSSSSTSTPSSTNEADLRASVTAMLTGASQSSGGVASTSSTETHGPRARDTTLSRAGRAVIFPIPGYVIGVDMNNASLVIMPPSGASLASASFPDAGDSSVMAVGTMTAPPAGSPGAGLNITTVTLIGLSRGRARLVLNFTDGTYQSVHYYVLPAFRDHISAYGTHAATVAWLSRDFVDPFGRSASVMPWSRDDGIHLLQDGRPFVVGLSDDAGAGANLGLASRVALAPTVLEASRLDDYVFWTLMGIKNDTALPPFFSLQDSDDNRIKMTLFYFYNPLLNGTGQTYYQETDKCTLYPSWCTFNSPFPGYNPSGWIATYRQFNFPHQLSVYYALYKVARDWDGVATAAALRHSWDWYLERAAETLVTVACPDRQSGNLDCIPSVGLMDGTVFREILIALNQEAAANSPSPGPYTWSDWAANITSMMYHRTVSGIGGSAGWVDMDYPAGSEFAFDTTGQEEVGIWGAYFNATSSNPALGELNARLVDDILGYQPSQPTFALHGGAWGNGDFSNNALWMVTGGWEREGGHYRAGLNSIPLVERWRVHPDDLYLLHVGLGGVTAVLPNVDSTGAPSMAFHTHPFVMEHDPNSGDWGLAFFGHTLGAGAYLVNNSVVGMMCFMCDLNQNGYAGVVVGASQTVVTPRDSFHQKVYIEPLGLYLNALTGAISNVSIDWAGKSMTVTLEAPGTPSLSSTTWEIEEAALLSSRPSEFVLAKPLREGATPFSNFRLTVEAAAPEDRPFTFTFASPAGAQLVRDAYEWAVGSSTAPGLAVITWA